MEWSIEVPPCHGAVKLRKKVNMHSGLHMLIHDRLLFALPTLPDHGFQDRVSDDSLPAIIYRYPS